jgi:hypothetical protein
MLSEIVAKREAFAASPATPAFREEEIVIKDSLSASSQPSSLQHIKTRS